MRSPIVKKLVLIIIVLAAAATWGFAIFELSDMNSASSNDKSSSLVEKSITSLFDLTNEYEITNAHISEEDLTIAVALVNAPLRKLAHATVYGVLAILLLVISRILFGSRKYLFSCLGCFVLCVLFAFADEYHQLFVAGRTGQFLDVVIDSIGAALGILFFSTYFIVWRKGQKSALKNPD